MGKIVLITFLLLTLVSPLFAYLDPGSGSAFLQLLLGGLAGLAVIIKLYFKKFISLFKKDEEDQDETKESQADPAK